MAVLARLLLGQEVQVLTRADRRRGRIVLERLNARLIVFLCPAEANQAEEEAPFN